MLYREIIIKETVKKYTIFLAVSLTIFIVLFGASLIIGEPFVSVNTLIEMISGKEVEKISQIVVNEIRLPRAIIALMSGMMLAITGVLLQDSFQNHLAGPELIGVSSGASFMMAIITVFHLPVSFSLHPLLAFIGGFTSGLIVIGSALGKLQKSSFILIGTAVSAFLGALVIIIISLGKQNDIGLMLFFLTGSLANRNWTHVGNLLPWFIIFTPASMLIARVLNLLRLGDEAAQGRGLPVQTVRLLILFIGVLLVSSVIANCGPIGYISLLAPHLARKMLRTENAFKVLPTAAMIGSVLLLGADLAARLLFYPLEIPVGLLTTIIGGSILLIFLVKRRSNK